VNAAGVDCHSFRSTSSFLLFFFFLFFFSLAVFRAHIWVRYGWFEGVHADTGIAPHLDPATRAAIKAGSSSGGDDGDDEDDDDGTSGRGSAAFRGSGAPLFTPDELLAMRGYLGPLLRVSPGIEVRRS
jgi:hypothetical protein